MTKKGLGQFLRQEAQDLTTIDVEPLEEDKTEEPVEQGTEQVTHKTGKRPTSTKAELEAIVTELTETLKQTQQKESTLQQQIADLQSKVDEQKSSNQQLQKELEQANLIKVEFAQAKNTVLQLAEANSKLIAEINLLKGKQADVKIQVHKKSQLAAEPLPKAQPNSTTDFAANTWLL